MNPPAFTVGLVRYGSLADILRSPRHVRFTPHHDHLLNALFRVVLDAVDRAVRPHIRRKICTCFGNQQGALGSYTIHPSSRAFVVGELPCMSEELCPRDWTLLL